MKHLSLILFSILIFSYKSNLAQEKSEPKPKCALRVNFGSPGSGIDFKKYEEVKKKYSFSRIDYNREKNRFLRKVESEIPD